VSLHVEAVADLGDLHLDVDLDIPAGRCLALAGPSGAGKSSSLRIAAGLLRPSSGRVTSGDDVWLDTTRGIDRNPEERRCGYVFQDYALFPHQRAWQNVAYALRDRPRRAREQEARDWLARFGLEDLAEARPATLSGGERQRVALARALARRPDVLLLDEPLSALDTRTRASAQRALAEVLRVTEVPAIVVTHDFAEAALLGDEVAIIDGGRVVQQGSASELAARPATAFVADFAGAVVLHGTAASASDGTTLVTLAGGHQIRSTDHGAGPVAATVFPWEITIEPAGHTTRQSAQNHLRADVRSITTIGGRVRLGLTGAENLTAEVTTTAIADLHLEPGSQVIATWKAAATRLVPLA
jgi:molybdate transport system ATP-binding protein